MADNRNFVNKFANQGGGDIFVEDAKLSESTSTTTVTTEGLLLKGTDGAYYEIDKASLSEVIRAELGAILADNSKNNGTSVGKVPTLNSTGNALGASSVANLASVLGEYLLRIDNAPITVDANSIHTTGMISINGDSSNIPSDIANGSVLLTLMSTLNFGIQMIFDNWGTLHVRGKVSTNWRAWKEVQFVTQQ